jgi:hypothetical protein
LHDLYDQLKEKDEFSFEPRHILWAAVGLAIFGAAMLYSGILLSERGGVHTSESSKLPLAMTTKGQPVFVANRDMKFLKNGHEKVEPELVHVRNLGSAIPARTPNRTASRKHSNTNKGFSRVLRSVGPVPLPEPKEVRPPKAPSVASVLSGRKVEAAVAVPLRQVHRTMFRRVNTGGKAIGMGTEYTSQRIKNAAGNLATKSGLVRSALRRSLGRAVHRTAENYIPPKPVIAPEPEPVVAIAPTPQSVAVLPKFNKPKRKAITVRKARVVKPAPAKRAYTIQIHAFKDVATAREVANAIGKFHGKKAVIRTQQRDSMTWYRVQIGSFTNLADARSYQKDFEAQKGLANTFLVAR